jgi:hypothetical protein
MKVAIYSYVNKQFCNHKDSGAVDYQRVQLVLAFGAKQILADDRMYNRIRHQFPSADIVLCSTAGEIFDNSVLDGTVSITALEFEDTSVRSASVDVADFPSSYEAGIALMHKLSDCAGLSYVMIISDGSRVNGSELVRGLGQANRHNIPITGGLAGDGANFISTLAGLNREPVSGQIVAVGFYGNRLRIAHGSLGGWEMFGPEKTVTSSKGNQLYKVNDESALDIYKKYLGPYADELPGSALLFPLSLTLSPERAPVVRTILSIDPQSKSMVFAGDVPEGSKVRFMKANFDKLIDAASMAARQTIATAKGSNPPFALLISCVGRKIILESRIEEEVMAVKEVLGNRTLVTGFYSYGEISPFLENTTCELHNQTMTITTFDEK